MSEEKKFWLNPDYDLTQIKSSVQIPSGTTLATLEYRGCEVSLETRGEIKIFFNPDVNGDPDDGEYYTNPEDYPEALADIISGKTIIYRKDGDTEGIEHDWALDDRVYVSENNWFEAFITPPGFDVPEDSSIVDAEVL